MKESKFIELLNLYIDRRITPGDAELLEAEILHDPQRRTTYTEYCRMHRACTLALERFGDQSDTEEPAGTVAFAPPRRVNWGYYAAGLAAACVALVAVHSLFRSGRTFSTSVAAAQSGPALVRSESAVVLTPARMPSSSGARTLSKTESYIVQQLRLISPMVTPTNRMSLAVANHRGSRNLPLLAPPALLSAHPSIEDFVFAPERATPDDTHIFRVPKSADGQTEMNAIEFQRQ